MKKRTLQNLKLQKQTISNLRKIGITGMRGDTGGSGDTHPDYTCHPETCIKNEQ